MQYLNSSSVSAGVNALCDFGCAISPILSVSYVVRLGVVLNEDKRPKEGSTITVVFNFVIEGDENQKSKAQKLFESLLGRKKPNPRLR